LAIITDKENIHIKIRLGFGRRGNNRNKRFGFEFGTDYLLPEVPAACVKKKTGILPLPVPIYIRRMVPVPIPVSSACGLC